MKKRWLVCIVLALAGIDVRAPGRADEPNIDRTIRKEPVYKSKKPKYCLLAFGPAAETRLWLVADKDTFYLDLNGNGDLTETSERIEIVGEIAAKTDDGQTFYTSPLYEQQITDRQQRRRFDVSFQRSADYEHVDCNLVTRDGQVTRLCNCEMADSPKDAQILRIDGALSLQIADVDGSPLVRGKEAKKLFVCLGTFGAKSNALVQHKGVPADVHPVAEIEFPGKQAGDQPIKTTIVLNQRCCGTLFHAPVRVPDEAGEGKARVRLSFAAWKEGKVAPAQVDVPVVDAPQGAKGS